MPEGNKKGPTGQGPMTGKRLGYCTGQDGPGFTNLHPNRGQQRGKGHGRCRRPGAGRRHRNWFEISGTSNEQQTSTCDSSSNHKEEVQLLETQIAQSELALEELKSRLNQLQINNGDQNKGEESNK